MLVLIFGWPLQTSPSSVQYCKHKSSSKAVDTIIHSGVRVGIWYGGNVEAPVGYTKRAGTIPFGTSTMGLANYDWAGLVTPASRFLSMCSRRTSRGLHSTQKVCRRIGRVPSFTSIVWCVASIIPRSSLHKFLCLYISTISFTKALSFTKERFAIDCQFCGDKGLVSR